MKSATIHFEMLERAEEFLEAFRQLPIPERRRISWPRYFLLCHAIELALKAFLSRFGLSPGELQKKYGHRIDPLMREALARGLQIGPLAEGEIMRLDEPHAKHWPRYPRAEDKPILMIDNFEPYAAELFRGVSKAIRGG